MALICYSIFGSSIKAPEPRFRNHTVGDFDSQCAFLEMHGIDMSMDERHNEKFKADLIRAGIDPDKKSLTVADIRKLIEHTPKDTK